MSLLLDIYYVLSSYYFNELKFRVQGPDQPPPNSKYPTNDDFMSIRLTAMSNIILDYSS